MTIDHETFHAMEIDALYEELDAPGASALSAHAASCASCGPRYERLQRARQRGLAAMSEQVSGDFESRVMAAVDAALAARAPLPSNVIALPSRAPSAPIANAPAKVIPFYSRPLFAAAATLFLVIGAATILSQKSMSKRDAVGSSPMAVNAPAASIPAGQAGEPEATVAPAPTAFAALASSDTPAASASGSVDESGALALNDQAKHMAAAPAKPAARSAKPSMEAPAFPTPSPAAPPPAAALAGAASNSSGKDITFGAAKQLYNAGRYREALAKFEVLASANPEADLYAARCIQRTSGCTAAAPRFDAVASRYAGSGIGRAAASEANSCYAALGQTPPTAGAGTPNMHASPKKAVPAPAATATEAPPAAADTDEMTK